MPLFERQRAILDFTLASLLRRKGRNAAVLAVYTLVVCTLASLMFFSESVRREAAVVLAEAPQLVVQRQIAGRHETIPLAYGEKISAIPGVTAVRERLWGYYYDPVFGATYTLQVPERLTQEEGHVTVGRGVARSALAEVGNIMPFRTVRGELFTLTVAGVLPEESELVTSDLVLLSPTAFRTLFGLGGDRASDLVVEVANPADLAAVTGRIRTLLPDTRAIVRSDILQTYESLFSWRSGAMRLVLGGAFLALLIFAWDKGAGLSSGERREIGILKAVGWGAGDVLTMKLWEGILVSVSAFLVGVILAYLHIFLAGSVAFVPILKGWSVLYPAFRLAPAVDPGELTLLFALTVIPYLLAAILPAWRAAVAEPDGIMGH